MSLFAQVQDQVRASYTHLQDRYAPHLLDYLLSHKNIIEAKVAIEADDGTTKEYTAYRAQHSDVRGPCKGGIRFHQNVSLDEVKSLSAWMSFKTAVVDLPLGGGKGGIIVNPKELSSQEIEQLSRGYIKQIYTQIGPETDVPAPDVNTTSQIMGWMADEYAKQTGKRTPGVITGKPLAIGGSKGRETATSLGGIFVIKQYLKAHNDSLKGKKIVIQGAGNVGLNFGLLAASEGATIIAISDSKGAIHAPGGIAMQEIEKLKNAGRSVTELPAAEKISNDKLLSLACDILAPAALENQLTKENADQIDADIILELANGPTTSEADTYLAKAGKVVLPDILANAGGVTVSYFEQVQNNTNYYREKDAVEEKLQHIMNKATDTVVASAATYKTTLREAAYIIALERLLAAMEARGW